MNQRNQEDENPYNYRGNPFFGFPHDYILYNALQRQLEKGRAREEKQRRKNEAWFCTQQIMATLFAKLCLLTAKSIAFDKKPCFFPPTRNVRLCIIGFLSIKSCRPNRGLLQQMSYLNKQAALNPTPWYAIPILGKLISTASSHYLRQAFDLVPNPKCPAHQLLLDEKSTEAIAPSSLGLGHASQQTVRRRPFTQRAKSRRELEQTLFFFMAAFNTSADDYRKRTRSPYEQRRTHTRRVQLDSLQREIKSIYSDTSKPLSRLLQIRETIETTQQLIIRSHKQLDRGFIGFFLALFARLGITRSRLERQLDGLRPRLTITTHAPRERTAAHRPRI